MKTRCFFESIIFGDFIFKGFKLLTSFVKGFLFFFTILSSLSIRADSLGVLVHRFVELSPVISAGAAEERAAFWELKSARTKVFPQVYFSGQALDSRSPLSTFGIPGLKGFADREIYTASINLEQPLYLGGQIWSSYRLKELGYQDAKWRYMASKQREISRFVNSIIRFLSLDEQIAIVKRSQRTQERFLQLTRKRYKKGIAKLYELQQVEAEFLSFIPRIEQLKQERQILLKQLEIQLGRGSLNGEKMVIEWSKAGKKTLSLSFEVTSQILDLAKKQRFDYQQALIQVGRAEAQKKLSLGEYRPSLSFMASWGLKSGKLGQLGGEGTQDRSVALNIKVPLFSGFSSIYTRKSGQEVVESAEKRRRQLEQDVKLELKKTLSNYKSSLSIFKKIRQWHNKAREALKSGEKSYRVGVVGSFQIHQLQGASERASLSFVEARAGMRMAELNYSLAMGEDLYQKYAGTDKVSPKDVDKERSSTRFR